MSTDSISFNGLSLIYLILEFNSLFSYSFINLFEVIINLIFSHWLIKFWIHQSNYVLLCLTMASTLSRIKSIFLFCKFSFRSKTSALPMLISFNYFFIFSILLAFLRSIKNIPSKKWYLLLIWYPTSSTNLVFPMPSWPNTFTIFTWDFLKWQITAKFSICLPVNGFSYLFKLVGPLILEVSINGPSFRHNL